MSSINGIKCKTAKDTGEMVKAVEGKFLVVVAPVLKGAAFLDLLLYSLRQDREDVPVANINTTAI